MTQPANTSKRARNLAIFGGCALVWFILDQVVKGICEAAGVGTTLVPSILGLVQIHVVHNYGAAWSMFEGSTIPLILIAVVICAALIAFAIYESKNGTVFEMLAAGLVLAGGLGNMVDRITYGYVVDMIAPLFIDFPTFNVADMGVTCGVALLFIAVFLQIRKADAAVSDSGTNNSSPDQTKED